MGLRRGETVFFVQPRVRGSTFLFWCVFVVLLIFLKGRDWGREGRLGPLLWAALLWFEFPYLFLYMFIVFLRFPVTVSCFLMLSIDSVDLNTCCLFLSIIFDSHMFTVMFFDSHRFRRVPLIFIWCIGLSVIVCDFVVFSVLCQGFPLIFFGFHLCFFQLLWLSCRRYHTCVSL